jgi:hypothetical protein
MVRLLASSRALTVFTLGCLALVCRAPSARAQTTAGAQAPAHISIVEGVVGLERDGKTDDSPANMPLLAGDRVRTRSGRAEILFVDGSTLHLDNNSAIDLQSDELVRLIDGRIRVSIPGPAREVSYRIDAPQGWAHISEPGDYRVSLMESAGGGELELAVIRGRAELANEGGRTPLRAGERAFARAGAAPSDAYVANSAATDAFDRWSEALRDQRIAASTEYLPEEVRPYAASLEQYGYWRDEPVYGHVWYPRVAVGWRPYYRGRWVSLRPYGWTWVAHDPWGWPTHHYGRWGISPAGAWFWVPGRTWGAAWVSWAYAPGYVSWCPLGWNNRPLFHINAGYVHGYDPWRAWTVVATPHFGHGYVHNYAVRASHIDRGTLSAFASRDRAPEIRNAAGARRSAPIGVAGTRPRPGSAPLYTNVPADRARVNTDGARIRVADGARPSPSSSAGAALPVGRAMPSRPAVRSDRGMPQYRNGSTVAGRGEGASAAQPDGRSDSRQGARPRVESPDSTPHGNIREYDRFGREVPRYEPPSDRRSSAPTPDASGTPGARQRVDAPGPAMMETPGARRLDASPYDRRSPIPSRPSYEGARPMPSYEPRGVPRAEPSRPMSNPRPAQSEGRGPDRAPAGSTQRGAAPAQRGPGGPSAGPAGGASAGRSSTPPSGARPSGRGGGRGRE